MKVSTDQHEQPIIKLLNIYLEDSVSHLPPDTEMAARYQFSPAFDSRMQPLMAKARKLDQRWNQQNQPQARLRKRLVLIAVILAILASLAAVAIARQQIWEFIVTTYERYSKITFNYQQDPDPKFRLGPEHLKIPASYQEIDRFESADSTMIIYQNKQNEQVVFERSLISGSPLVDTENAIVEEIFVRGQGAMCITKNGYVTIIWQEYYDSYILSGPLSQEELMAILP